MKRVREGGNTGEKRKCVTECSDEYRAKDRDVDQTDRQRETEKKKVEAM